MNKPEKINLSFGTSNNLRDASFSSYLDGDGRTRESFVLKLTHPNNHNIDSIISTPTPTHQAFVGKKKVEDGEIGIFGAEKYFKGAIDDGIPISFPIQSPRLPVKWNQQEGDKQGMELKHSTSRYGTPSIRSESSWNSRSALVRRRSINPRKETNKTANNVKSLLACIRCTCIGQSNSVSVDEGQKRGHCNDIPKQPTRAKTFSGRWADEDLHGQHTRREDIFSFPVLNSKIAKRGKEDDGETRKSLEVFGSPILDNEKKSFSLERKLKMLNWDGVTPRMDSGYNDAASDASSDLFELESCSTYGNSFFARQTSDGRSSCTNPTTCYAPSEVSIEWSVVTASAADYSVVSDYEESIAGRTSERNDRHGRIERTSIEMQRRGQGILSGCKSHKAVRVAGDEFWTTGEKGIVNARDRHRMDSTTPTTKFQADTKLTTGFDSRRGQHPFELRPIARPHPPQTSHHMYIQ